VRTTITTKKLKCISMRPPEMSTRAAEPVSSPIDAATDRHLVETPFQLASHAKASIANSSGEYWKPRVP
jgi:hypothetical protein